MSYHYYLTPILTYQQGTDPCEEFDWEELGKSTALGATGGIMGRKGADIGKNIKDYSKAVPTITNINYPSVNFSGPIINYGNTGAAIGTVGGNAISNSGGNN